MGLRFQDRYRGAVRRTAVSHAGAGGDLPDHRAGSTGDRSGPIRELRNVVTTKVPLGMMKTARDRAARKSAVAEAEAMVRSARLFFYDTSTRGRRA